MKRLVITLGMHRSGTSLLSAALEGVGVEFGGELIGPAPDNPKGFWEDRTVVDISERMYRALGVTSSTLGVDCNQMEAGTRWRFQLQIARWLKSRLGGEGLLGLKDPRLPRLMDIWSPVLDRLKVDYWLLIPLRNPLSVAASLTARDGFSAGKGLLLWYEHMVRALQFANGKRFVIVDYDKFLEQPEVALAGLGTWLGQQPDQQALERFRGQVFDPGLRHATYDLGALEQHPDSFPELVRLYRVLQVLSIDQSPVDEWGLSGEIEQIEDRFSNLWPVLRQCGLWDMELWKTGQFCQQQESSLRQCTEERLRRETELNVWISTLEHTLRQEQAGRAETENWCRQIESNCQEQAAWISTLEHTLRQEQAGRAETENWCRQIESNCQEQAMWISTLENTLRQEQAGRAETENWCRQIESNCQEQATWISTLENTIRQEQAGRAEAENWFRQIESNCQEQAAWISTLENTIRREQAGRAEAESWLRQVESNYQEQVAWISTLTNTIREEQAGRAEAENWLRQVEANCREHMTWISTLENTIREEQVGRAEAESWLRHVEGNCQKQVEWISTLEHTVREGQAERAEAENRLRQVESYWQEQLQTSAQRVVALARELDTLQYRSDGLQNRLDEMLASRSWRLTAPLRRRIKWW